MKLSKYLNTYFYLLIAVLFLSTAFFISNKNEKPAVFVNSQQSTININENFWLYFNLGQKRLLSSLYWVSTILESDVVHYKERDLNSWMFIRFNTISIIDPQFYENYSFGGPYLSIIKDDLVGADILYSKGLIYYPDDYSLLLNSGFHYYFEQRNPDKAFPIWSKLKTLELTPQYVISAIARIESERGNLGDSLLILKEYQSRFPKNSRIWENVNEQIYSVKSELDLECLNNHLSNCSKNDWDGNPYILIEGKYKASRNWVLYRPKWKKI